MCGRRTEMELLRLKREHLEDMIAHSLEEYPNECCGIIVGSGATGDSLFRVTNAARQKRVRFLMDSAEQARIMHDAVMRGKDILAFYHSHPNGEARPSIIDVRMALKSNWLDVKYILVSLKDIQNPDVRLFRITEDGGIVEEEIQII